MGRLIYSNLLAAIFLLIGVSCQSIDKKITVRHAGALKTIMSGNIEPVISLDSLRNKKNLYALGAVESLKGEIQIFDSEPHNSSVVDGNINLQDSYNIKASLLVYAEVEEWEEFIITGSTKEELEQSIFETAKSNGLNIEQPFPFLLDGLVTSLDWHVIDWPEGDTVHSHEKHKQSGISGNLTNREVMIIGFYSSKHKAVFTHHTTNIHMHFKTYDNSIAGHVDDLITHATITLKLPKQ